jgi:anaerobic magnesium-protoporphyrin IX monomethyl ester cyclase
MPDSFEHTPSLTMRMPNGALASIAGNVDAHHDVAIADLVLVQDRVRDTVERLVVERQPDVVGLSVMTFQRRTAQRLLRIIKALRPDSTIVLGGYDPSLAADAYEDPSLGVDFIVRGEGDLTMRELLRALERPSGTLSGISGLSWRSGDRFVHNPERSVSSLDGDAVRLPNRAARVLKGYTFLGRPIDVVETSRGCTYDCSWLTSATRRHAARARSSWSTTTSR